MYNWIGRRVRMKHPTQIGTHNANREGRVIGFSYLKGDPIHNMIEVLFDGESHASNYYQWRFELIEDNKSLPLPG